MLLFFNLGQTYIMSSMSSDTSTKSEYNSIDDFSIINMKRINSEISLRLGDFFRSDSPCGTPKSTRSTGDITENSNQVRNERVKNSPSVPPRRNMPGLPTHLSTHIPRHHQAKKRTCDKTVLFTEYCTTSKLGTISQNA